MGAASFPVFDLGQFETSNPNDRKLLGAEVDGICRTTGFLAIANHEVPPNVIDTVWLKAREFFDLPLEVKLKSKPPFTGYPYGYFGPELETLAKSRNVDTPHDLKESFNGGPLSAPGGLSDADATGFFYAETIWPSEPDGFVEAWKAYYCAMENLAARIMRLFAVALKLPETYFDRFIDAPISALRALNYPEQRVPPKPEQLRAGAHSDYGSLTILLPQAGSKGLEIVSPTGEWTPVPPVPGAFIINIGDLMARWANDRWVSTVHRVVNPPAEESGTDRRQSLAFFHQPNWDAEITALQPCLALGEASKYAPVRSGEYLIGRRRLAS
jgi:isopenicillin N synthase-like dioxygenase